MKICFIADGRSPIARNWIAHFSQNGHDVHIISTYRCPAETYPGTSVHEVTSTASRRAGSTSAGADQVVAASSSFSIAVSRARMGRFADLALAIQHWVERSEVERRSSIISGLLREIKPDLVHAMRLPFEGIMAALADPPAPLLMSIWGNDLTLFARRFRSTRRYTQWALGRTDALHCDCYRDLKLASEFGFDSCKPSIVVPGSGGIEVELLARRPEEDSALRSRFGIPQGAHIVCNPRGFRGYVRNGTFFRSIALTIKRKPDLIFAAVGMQGHPVAQRWVSSLRLEKNVRLLPTLSRAEMFALLGTSDIVVSPSEHDGTPNTLLESMAVGAFPICGDIESVREWITDGVNGKLRQASDPEGFAEAILSALADPALRALAAERNRRIVQERAEYFSCMKKAEELYESLVSRPEVPRSEFYGTPQ